MIRKSGLGRGTERSGADRYILLCVRTRPRRTRGVCARRWQKVAFMGNIHRLDFLVTQTGTQTAGTEARAAPFTFFSDFFHVQSLTGKIHRLTSHENSTARTAAMVHAAGRFSGVSHRGLSAACAAAACCWSTCLRMASVA